MLTKEKTYAIINIENEREENNMREVVFFIEYNIATEKVAHIEMIYPCFIEVESIEMGYAKVTIKARTEDMPAIEKYLMG